MIYLLPHAIDRAAERDSDQEAFRCQGNCLTYGALVAQSNRLAHWLLDNGVERGSRVGIYMPRCLESAVAVYGIIKAGAAYVPLDPQTPPEGLRQLIEDCGIRHLITDDAKHETLEQLCVDKSRLEAILGLTEELDSSLRSHPWSALTSFPADHAPDLSTMEQDLAYIMYTSGSTGRPKGIMHTHASGLSYAALSVKTYDVQPTDRIGNHSPLHFDMSTFGYFSGPYAGATSVLIPEAHTKLPASLSQLIESEQLTIWYSVPFALIQLLLRGALEQRDLSHLRWVLFGGEPFSPKYMRSLMAQWPHARFSNVYGPAEVNQCTYFHVPPLHENGSGVADPNQPIPIGKAWDNTEALVVDDDDKPISPGQTGELLIRSPTMMQGYWARPDLDSVAFFRQAVYTNLERVFYRTGDLVRIREDGNILFLGRKDRQVKIRGYRIELDEIELALTSHVQVEEAAAFPVRLSDEVVQVEAAVTLRDDATLGPKDLLVFVSQRLRWYAVPGRITIAQSFSRTTSGKIDRREMQRIAETAYESA